ncbi:MAG: MucR family transcriptional regulator [Phenylobacterium sp.]|uniref:MucR family transcriptional regulator n=1 Tax=Phenylobacterium sp. TaxID=1871053 RepID=UPI00391C7C6B
MSEDNDRLRELVADVAAAYFSNTHVAAAEIPHVIQQIASSLMNVSAVETAPQAEVQEEQAAPKLTSAQIRKSITPDALISFEDGKPYRTLKRHLSTRGLTPEEYRQKWGLPRDYPMVASSYSEARSAMAKSLGLGRKSTEAAPRRAGRAKSA